jgi:hypothetical protein
VATPSPPPPPSGGDMIAANSVFVSSEAMLKKGRKNFALSTTVIFLFHMTGLISYTPPPR